VKNSLFKGGDQTSISPSVVEPRGIKYLDMQTSKVKKDSAQPRGIKYIDMQTRID